jgi:hypothetical protein
VFEVLHGAFMFLSRLSGLECAKIPPLVRFRVFFARVQAKFAGFYFSDHDVVGMSMTRSPVAD